MRRERKNARILNDIVEQIKVHRLGKIKYNRNIRNKHINFPSSKCEIKSCSKNSKYVFAIQPRYIKILSGEYSKDFQRCCSC